MDDFPFSYIINKNTDIINKSKKKDKYKSKKKDTSKKTIALIHSNSDSDFIMKTEKERRKIIRHYLNKKKKLQSIRESKDSKKSSPFKKGKNLKKIIKKSKNELSDYIENNSQKVKLFGNPRYHNSPILFVEDYKNNLPEKKMGLVPLPSKKKNETDIYKEPKKVYDMQRNITMVRRYQYEKKNDEKKFLQKNKNGNKDNEYFNMVQNWWKKIPKIIDIQRIFRGYNIRKQVNPILKLYRFMKNFERFLINLELKGYLDRIKDYSVLRRRKILNGSYISKKRDFISTELYQNIKMIENGFRCFKANQKRIFLQRGKNGRIINHMEYITKVIYIEQNEVNNNILKLQNNVKNYLNNKKYIDKNLIQKNNGVYYYDKTYLNAYNQKIIEFMKLMTHGLQLMAFKKKIYYKNPNEYDIDDINKIKYIQKKYLDHYYNNIKNISFFDIKNIIYFVDIIRKQTVDKEIKTIQKQIKTHLDNKKNYENNIIRNKPISDNKNIINIDDDLKDDNLKSNINNSSYITKENIININNKLIPAQKLIHKFIQKKYEKNKAKKKRINKTDFHNNYFFTKEYSNQEKCIKKIKNFQKFYKSQYQDIKDNIINGDEEYSVDYNSLEDYSIPKILPLRQVQYKNKIPKPIEFGLYISKIKYINYKSKYTINYNKNDILPYRQEGLFISKIRHRNNENKIKTIQKSFKKYNKINDILGIVQKPPTDNKNFYTFSSDSYEDVIYSKKLNNYYYLTKVTRLNFDEKVKKIQKFFLKHENSKKNENLILNKNKILFNQRKNNGFAFYASKIRLGKIISKNISNNRNKNKNINCSIPIKPISYISKNTYYNNEKKILFIQKNLRNKIQSNMSDKNRIISRKNILKNKNNNDIVIDNGAQQNIISNNIKDGLLFSLGLIISKKYKRIIYKKEITKNSLITKKAKNPENMTQINIKFLLLISLFIKKNIRQYIFYLLKNSFENFEYPFYLDTINRVLKFLQSNESKGKNVQFLFNKIFSDYNSNNTIKKDLILLLTKEKEEILKNTNIYNNIDRDFSEYICQFSKFDKKLKNEKFLNVRLNNTIFHNTNIFTITKFIDDEFDNFVNGKYCYKCYLDLKSCKCFKSNDELTDEALDIGLNDDYNPKNSIKFFEYDNNKTRGALIEGKPKIDNKDNIITKNHFNNQLKESKLNDRNKKKNNLINSKKRFECLRYYDKQEDEKDKIKLRDNNI